MRYIIILSFLLISFSLFSEDLNFYKQKKDNFIKSDSFSNSLIVRRSGGRSGGSSFSSRSSSRSSSSRSGFKRSSKSLGGSTSSSSWGSSNRGSYSAGYIDADGNYTEGESDGDNDNFFIMLTIFCMVLGVVFFLKFSSTPTREPMRENRYNSRNYSDFQNGENFYENSPYTGLTDKEIYTNDGHAGWDAPKKTVKKDPDDKKDGDDDFKNI